LSPAAILSVSSLTLWAKDNPDSSYSRSYTDTRKIKPFSGL